MRAYYLCPHCRGILNAKDDIILSAENSKGEKGLLLLHPEIGNYSSSKSKKFKIDKGDKLSLYCSICHSSLDSKKHKNFAQIQLLDVNNHESTIIFSKIYGEKVTLKVDESDTLSYGEHCKRYSDPEWFL
ncbi:hypothetical protein [Ancylomarina sp. 16SWW S1-10-2]|uniref:hypothetical protein n=1 Tax=Ancylomarina sp. 16SWW S1-10-2 TaxID=2499681 RepID=UPI0012AD8A48|nr:hypothetical protein [Ancylomarina sp. 16SWW S1-10-2]MRT92754.1 hypothetical protein [Ancylomarina sp. 16SWW S1-10-2]